MFTHSRTLTTFILGTLSLTTAAPASETGGDKGHGGRGTVCFGKYDAKLKRREILSATLQDFDEAKLGSWIMDLGVDHPGVDDTAAMIQVAIDRLMKRDAYRAKLVAKRAEEVLATWHGLDLDSDKFEIAEIAGNHSLIETSAEGCFPKQLAFNKVKPGLHEFKYAYVEQFVQALPDAHRAGLVLHEALYNLEAAKGALDSDGVRKQVLAMSSRQFPEIGLADYWEFIEANSLFPSVTAENGSFTGTRIHCTSDCNLAFVGETVAKGHFLEAATFPAAAVAEIRDGHYVYHRLDFPVKFAAGAYGVFERVGREYLPKNGLLQGVGFTAELSNVIQGADGKYGRFLCTPKYVSLGVPEPTTKCSGFDPRTGSVSAAYFATSLPIKAQLLFPQGKASVEHTSEAYELNAWFRVIFNSDGSVSQTQLIKQYDNAKINSVTVDTAGKRTESEHRIKNMQRIYWDSEAGTVMRTTYSKDSVESDWSDLTLTFDAQL